jgi:ABC-type uncharacterized transport system YnjBCD ATPase subunit
MADNRRDIVRFVLRLVIAYLALLVVATRAPGPWLRAVAPVAAATADTASPYLDEVHARVEGNALHFEGRLLIDMTLATGQPVPPIPGEGQQGVCRAGRARSGCGKSTTCAWSRAWRKSLGRDLYRRQEGQRCPPKDRDIAMVFQNYALYPHMTVYDNMAFGLKLRKMPKDEIDRRVQGGGRHPRHRTSLLDRKPKALSGGQRQRVAVGRAIVRKPKVFLFDEPLSNLDAKLRVQMRAEISKLHSGWAPP